MGRFHTMQTGLFLLGSLPSSPASVTQLKPINYPHQWPRTGDVNYSTPRQGRKKNEEEWSGTELAAAGNN